MVFVPGVPLARGKVGQSGPLDRDRVKAWQAGTAGHRLGRSRGVRAALAGHSDLCAAPDGLHSFHVGVFLAPHCGAPVEGGSGSGGVEAAVVGSPVYVPLGLGVHEVPVGSERRHGGA